MNILKKINVKDILIILSLILCQVIVYFFTKPFLNNLHLITSPFDNNIPFIPEFVWFYIIWYIMIFFVPYYISKKDKTAFFKYSTAYIISISISIIIFISFPNTVERATITSDDISSKIVQIIYNLDTPGYNCLPSIHCLLSFLFIFGVFSTNNSISKLNKGIIILLSFGIVLSTCLIKQHVIYDVLLALLIVAVVWYLVVKLELHKWFENKIYNKIKL